MTQRSLPLRAAVVLIVALTLGLSGVSGATAAPPTSGGSTYLPFHKPAKGVEVVKLGVEPIGFDNVSVSSNTYQTSFYVWWRWHGKIDPVPTTDVLNSTPSAATYVINYSYTDKSGAEKPLRLPDGAFYQTARVSTGVSNPFSVGRYPLDRQVLRVRFENNTYDASQLFYEPDVRHMSPHPHIDVAGWNVTGTLLSGTLHQYGTDFGLPGTAGASLFSQVVYYVAIERPISHFTIKLFLPLLIVLLTTVGAMFLKHDDSDVRPVAVATGMLALVFLQQSYASDLPPTAPGVLLDDIYVAAYIVVAITFVRMLYLANQVKHLESDRHAFFRGTNLIGLAVVSGFLIAVLILLFL